MKLHLPKQLFTALLAAITLAAPATLSLGSTAWGGWSGDSFTLESATTDSISTEGQTPGNLGFFIRTGEDADMAGATVTLLQLQAGDNLYIDGSWQDKPVEFTGLTIETLAVKDGGSATLNVYADNSAYINALTGSLSSVTNSGNLTFGAADNTTNSFSLGNITNSGKLTINGPVTLASASTLNLAEGSNLVLNNAGEIVFNSHDADVGITTTGDSGTVTIGSGTTVKLTNTGQEGVAAIDGIIKVQGGGKLRLEGGKSQLGHSNLNDATDAVYLKGDSAGNMATMEFATDEAQHLTTNLYLQGYAQVTTAANITGHIETYDGDITATGTNNYIDAKVQVNRDITVEVTGADDTLELRGYVYDGAKAMTKAGDGTLTFSNAGANKNSLSKYTHNSGITELNTEFSFTSSLTVNAGEVQAKGKTTISGALNLQGGDLAVYGNTTISGNITQNEGTLTIQQGGNLVLNAASFAGDISLLGSGTLTLAGAYNKTANLSFTTGVTELVNFSQVGAGALNLGTVNLTGDFLRMNYEGGAIHVTSLGTVAEGMELVYGKGSQLVNLGTFNQRLTLNFFDVADQLGTGVNLGLSLGGKTLEEAKTLLTVNGLDSGSYTLSEQNGNVYLTSTSALTSGWDDNWGGLGLTKLPTSSTTLSVATAGELPSVTNSMNFHMLKNTFEAGEVLSVTLEDTTETEFSGALVGGFATTTSTNSHGSLVERDVWIRAKSGVYHSIIGGNLCDNYNAGGTAVNFEGNTHILVEGATVGTIIGGNNKDGNAPVFNGSSFISVMSGNVTSSIIGAGTNAHNATTTFNGDTNIFIYVPLDTNDTTGKFTDAHAVIGGGAKITNNIGTSIVNGDTNITIDLSAYTGERTTFIKNIIGGHYNVSTGTINGTTNITVTGKSGVSFTGLIVGGDYSTSTGTKTVGATDVTITDGSFSNSIVGGSYITGASNNTVGTTNVNIKGGIFTTTSRGGAGDNPYDHVIAGGHLQGANVSGAVMNATSTNVTITGGTVGMDIFGGHVDRLSQSSGNALTATLDSATVTLNGAGASVQNIYGGSFTQRDNTGVNITQGDIVVDLIAGTVNGNVYAGGRQVHNSKITTENTEVRISDGVVFTSNSAVVSGAYQIGCTSHTRNNPSTVTGTKTLVFNGASQNRTAIIFDSFNTIQVTNADAGVTLNTLTNITDLTKTGEGTLTLSGTLGASEAALGSITVNGGNLEILNTSYVTSVNMTGGNLTYGGTGVTHTISEGVTSSDGSQNSTFAVASGSAVDLASLNNAWGVNLDIDGTVAITGSLTQAFNSSGMSISGDGCVTAGSLDVSNQSKFDVVVTTLKVNGGFNMSGNSSKVTFTSGSTTTISGATNIATNRTEAGLINKVIFEGGIAELNGAVTNGAIIEVNAGSATLNGAVTNTGSINVNGGSATLKGGISGAGTVALTGGSLILGSDEGVTNEIAQFNYSSGTLSHSGLTVTNATFSGATLDNTANGTLTLNGTLNVTNIGGLTKGEGRYSGGDVEGNGYYTGSLTVITGNNNLSYGDSFELQLNGSELTTNSEDDTYYTKSAGSLTLNGTDTSTFIVNTGTESRAFDSTKSYYVASKGRLEFTGQQCTSNATNDTFIASVSGTGTVALDFDRSDHNESVQFGDGFNGELEVSGYMHLANFRLGKDATIKLASGQVWNRSATTSAYKILLAGENEESFSFIGSELTLTGEVTGTYLTTSANMNLLNAANNITQVKVKGGTTKLNAGTYGTVKVEGGTVNVTGGSVTTVDYTGSGTVNFKLAQGQSATSYTLDEIKNTDTSNYVRNLTVDSGVTLTTGNLTNSWGMGTMTINGTLIVNGEMKFSTGDNNSTSNNVLTGSGIVRTEKLIIGDSGKYNLSGLTLKIGSGGIIKDTDTFSGDHVMLNLGAMTIEATEDWSSDLNKIQLVGATGAPTVFNTAGRTITMSAGGISGTGELKKAGEGTLVLSGANSYTGATTVEGGTLQITEAAAVNSSAGVSMESGAGLKYTGSGTETLSTPLSGAGSFTMAGSGTLTLSGANTYTGATTVESGTLQVAGVSAINSSSGISIGSGAELKYTGSGEETLSTTLSDAGSFTMAGTGTLTVNTRLYHTGGTTIESGTLKQADTHSVLGEKKNVTVKNGATLDVNGQEAYYILTLGGGDAETAAVLTNTGVEVGDTKKQLYSITLADDATVTGDAGMCMVASNHGPATLNLAGNTLTKTGSNTFTISRATVSEGTIKVLQGKVLAKQAGNSGTGSLNLSAASVYVGNQSNSTGTFELDSVDQSVKDLTFDGGTVSTLTQKTLTATGTTQVKSTGGTLSGNLTATNEVSFENGGALNLGTSGKLKVQKAEDNDQYIELYGSAGTAASMTAKSDSALARLQEDASFTIQDMTLTNTTITAATTTTEVKLQNVEASDVVLAKGAFTTDATAQAQVAPGGDESGADYSVTSSVLSGITLNNTQATIAVDLGDLSSAGVEIDKGSYTFAITLDGFHLSDYETQAGVLFTADSWLGQLLLAQRADSLVSGSVETPASVSAGGSGVSVSYVDGGANVGTIIFINGLNVPEPASATLGLAALMMLCARRRRND